MPSCSDSTVALIVIFLLITILMILVLPLFYQPTKRSDFIQNENAIGYTSESLKLLDSMSENFRLLVKTIALERSKSAGESEVSPEGMKIAFNIAIQEFQNHRDQHACSENTIIECLKEMIKKHSS